MTVPTKVSTIAQLAKAFDLHSGTIKVYLGEGMPGKNRAGYYEVKKCLEWIQKHKLSKAKGQTNNAGLAKSSHSDDPAKMTKWDVEKKKLLLQCEKIEIELEEMRGTYLKRDDVLESLAAVRQIEKNELYSIGSRLSVGFGEIGPAIEKAFLEQLDASLTRLHSGELYKENGKTKTAVKTKLTKEK